MEENPMKHKPLYNWIAEVARLIPEAKFTPPKITYRDGKTRIRVIVGDNDQNFVISNHPPSSPAQPWEVKEHFDMDVRDKLREALRVCNNCLGLVSHINQRRKGDVLYLLCDTCCEKNDHE